LGIDAVIARRGAPATAALLRRTQNFLGIQSIPL
jgi:hypothetical protein